MTTRAEDLPAVERALDGLVAAMDLQTSLPTRAEPPWFLRLPADAIELFVWVAVACGLAALAWLLSDIIPKRLARRVGWDNAVSSMGDIGLSAGAETRANADELARRGDYAHAMHVLLLQSLHEVRERLGRLYADSLTSREMLGRSSLTTDGKQALRTMIEGVERAHFGDHRVDADDYARFRQRYAELEAALRAVTA